ncbi:lipopolysaccharide assembly protein LapB [Helicobacter trogontum]|uniref:Tetratricopeptide repeat protein n=1 Tax=Helicobacter trogontum TaxID=50960 RepID=A0A4U8TFQ8_9HELI|nr:tetratricopeptide repeat-containing glycosyltransferase family protein [Helicobacter trogontum]MCI5786329.1 tetratricopeptide repeat-containing glycosyltransferase family protein [Helicobacter trogontum]MDY5186212.1 tetratricopeptide repeat-containing glycosyltransferase family protein [Helicobacter trogontum]TLD98248.1 tetratricopeptide repeat protein [Helicobacter trogontum]
MNIEDIRQLFSHGKWQTCIEACLKLIMQQRTNIEAWSLCAFCYNNIGQLQEAIKCLEDALKIAKEHHKEHVFTLSLNLAEFYRRNNMTLQAVALLQSLLPKEDENLHFNLAKCYGDLQDYERSIQHYMMAIKINPKDVHAIFNLANQQAAIGSFKLALKYYSLAYENGMGDAGINLAQIYTNLDDLESALTLYKELETNYSQDSNFYFNYANALRYNNDVELAREAYSKAISLNPDVRYVINLAHLLLSLDDLQTGFALYEYRRVMLPKTMTRHFLDFSLHDPRDILNFLSDKKVALYHEQGFGDSIMFARFIPLLSCKEKMIFAPKELCRIFECFNIPCSDEIHDNYDVALPIPSLAFLFANKKTLQNSLESFRKTLSSFLIKKGGQNVKEHTLRNTFVHTNTKKTQISAKKILKSYQHYAQKEKLEDDIFLTSSTQAKNHFITHTQTQQTTDKKKPIRVALNFSSNPNFQNARDKSIYAQKLLEYLPRNGFAYYSLQYEGIDSDLAKEFSVIDMSSEINDFFDSADILLSMDFVISIDSALAHLSATLGIPTALLLHKRHDWRWGRFCKHDSTIWYDNIKLFIQDDLHEWRSVLENLNTYLMQKFIQNT